MTININAVPLQDLRVRLSYQLPIAFGAETTRHDYASIFRERLTDGVQRFLYGRVNEAAGIYHHQIGVLISRGDGVAFGAQLRKDLLGVNERLGAA